MGRGGATKKRGHVVCIWAQDRERQKKGGTCPQKKGVRGSHEAKSQQARDNKERGVHGKCAFGRYKTHKRGAPKEGKGGHASQPASERANERERER